MLYRLELACVRSAGRVADYSQELSIFRALSSLASAVAPDRNPGMLPGASEPKIKLIFDDRSGILLGGQVSGGSSVGELINTIALAIQKKITVSELDMMQIATHPLLTVAATVHPLISAVRQVPAKLRSTIKLVSDAKSMAAIIADGEGKDDQRSVRYRRLIVACTGHFITHGRRDKWLPY